MSSDENEPPSQAGTSSSTAAAELQLRKAREGKSERRIEVRRPKVENLRGRATINGAPVTDFDLPTFFTPGPEIPRAVETIEAIQNFSLHLKRNGRPRYQYKMGALCGHILRTPPEHKICRACIYSMTNQYCLF